MSLFYDTVLIPAVSSYYTSLKSENAFVEESNRKSRFIDLAKLICEIKNEIKIHAAIVKNFYEQFSCAHMINHILSCPESIRNGHRLFFIQKSQKGNRSIE